MDARPLSIAPPARIQRVTTPQRLHARRAELHLRALLDPTSTEIASRLARLSAALWSSPAHRERLARLGLSPRDLRSLDDLRHFPTLSRRELAERWSELAALDDSQPELSIARSSGTTGEPVPVIRDGYDNLHMWTVLRFWVARLGIELPRRPRVALLDALPGGLEYSVRVPLLDDGALHRISTARANAAERLRRVAPAVIFADPAGLHALLEMESAAPKLILTSAQPLSPTLRARFTSPLLDYYAATETGPIAWACLRAPERFHVLSPDVHVESVGGELAITRLRESVLPLLRYLPGDRGEVVDGDCVCGFHGRSIVGLAGRARCDFLRPDSSRVDAWSLAWIFKHHALRSFQLEQVEAATFRLRIDASSVDPMLLNRIASALVALGWTAPTIDVELCAASAATKHEPFSTRL